MAISSSEEVKKAANIAMVWVVLSLIAAVLVGMVGRVFLTAPLTGAATAVILGLNPNNLILDMVAYAWAGFGAAVGPALVMSLYWKRMTRQGALAAVYVASILDAPPSKETLDEFEQVNNSKI